MTNKLLHSLLIYILLVYIFYNETAFQCIGLDSETLINKVLD